MGNFRKHIAICPYCRKIVNAEHLTVQQWEVARRLIAGEKTNTIAHDLFVGRKTIEAHRQKIYEAIGVSNIPQLIRWAFDKGLLELLGWKSEVSEDNP